MFAAAIMFRVGSGSRRQTFGITEQFMFSATLHSAGWEWQAYER